MPGCYPWAMAWSRRFWQNLRFIPLVLVLLCANSETRQLVATTLQHLFACTQVSCGLEAAVPNATTQPSLSLFSGSSPALAVSENVLIYLVLLLLIAIFVGLWLPKPYQSSQNSRAPPRVLWMR